MGVMKAAPAKPTVTRSGNPRELVEKDGRYTLALGPGVHAFRIR
jgi:hypothetical protein